MGATLHIANMNGSQIIKEFYQRCGTEIIDGVATPISDILSFSNLEELFDNMIAHDSTHVIIAHGNAEQGLLIKFARESFRNATGLIMSDFATLAEQFPLGKFLKQIKVDITDPRIKNLAQAMGVRVTTLARLFEQLGIIRNHKYNIAFRGCNVGNNPDLLRLYKKALGASKVSAPACRNLFLRIKPGKPPFQTTMGTLTSSATQPTTPKTRRRAFFDPTYGVAYGEPIVIDVQDLDGHTNVSSKSFMNLPNYASGWGKELNLDWKQAPAGTGNNQFILQVMWDDLESSYHCRKDQSYPFKIISV
ncbi:MAG: hypothetical protein AB1757_28975 [Acidobacteriota bacterium]